MNSPLHTSFRPATAAAAVGLSGLAFVLAACKPEAPPPPQISPPPPPPAAAATAMEQAKSEGKQAFEAAKDSLGHAGGALKNLASVAKDKAGDALEAAKSKISEMKAESLPELFTKIKESAQVAKEKGGVAWETVQATSKPLMEKAKGLLDSVPEDKREAAKTKWQELMDLLNLGKPEGQPAASSPPGSP